MQAYPHHYTVTARGEDLGLVELSSPGLPALQTAAPPEFDGPGGVWTPENLLVAALADCYILMFRAVARASRMDWTSLECRAEGKLERVDGVTCFTRYDLHAVLTVPAGTDVAKARLLMEKAEKGCLVSNSLKAERVLKAEIRTT